jgi:hypothetical protein
MSARSIRVIIPMTFATGARCSVGAVLQLPLTIEASGVRACVITVHSEYGAIEPIRKELRFGTSGGEERTLVLELIAKTATAEPSWVSIATVCDGTLPHQAGFFLEIMP